PDLNLSSNNPAGEFYDSDGDLSSHRASADDGVQHGENPAKDSETLECAIADKSDMQSTSPGKVEDIAMPPSQIGSADTSGLAPPKAPVVQDGISSDQQQCGSKTAEQLAGERRAKLDLTNHIRTTEARITALERDVTSLLRNRRTDVRTDISG